MSKLRIDDNLLHGQTRTRDPEVVQLRKENLEANPPIVLLVYYTCWMLVCMSFVDL